MTEAEWEEATQRLPLRNHQKPDFFQDLRDICKSEDPVVMWDEALHPLLINVEFFAFHAVYTAHSGLEAYGRLDRNTTSGVQRGYYSRRLSRWSNSLKKWQPRFAFEKWEDALFEVKVNYDKMGSFYLEDLNEFRNRTDRERNAETNRLLSEAHSKGMGAR